MRETKEIELPDKTRYRLDKLSAPVASRIFNLLMSAVMKAQAGAGGGGGDGPEEPEAVDREERAKAQVGLMWLLASTALDDDQYAKIQGQCLASCALLDGAATVPVRMADGRWAVKALEYDAPAVNRLVLEALQFNIAPFFLVALSQAAPAPAI